MKWITSLFLVFIFLSCTSNQKQRNIDSLEIQEFKIQGTSIRAIHAVNKKSVYYAGSNGAIGFTNDGGQSWAKKTLTYSDSITPNFRSISLNNKNVFALSISNPALLYKISSLDTILVYKEIHEKVFYDSLHFFDDGIHAIAVGDPTEDCPSIIISSNSGKSWHKINCNSLPKFEEGEAFFAASNTNIKTLGSTVWIVSGGKKARVLKSTDFGKSWKIYNTPIIQGDGPQGIYSIDMANLNEGIIIGGDYSNPNKNYANKAITKNGGKNWILVSNNQEPNYKSCVTYVPDTNGKEIFAVGKTGISFSNDGGLTWKNISDEAYFTITFVDKYTAWLGGNEKMGKIILK